MEQGYLIDTNAIIDYLDNRLPEKSATLIDKIIIQMSVISRLELLSWSGASATQIEVLEDFIKASVIFDLTEPVISETIRIRRNSRIKLPDAIIAATAISFDLVLVTRNIADFKNINQLQLLSPHDN